MIDGHKFFGDRAHQSPLKNCGYFIVVIRFTDHLVENPQGVRTFRRMVHHLLSIGRVVCAAAGSVGDGQVSVLAGWIVDPKFGRGLSDYDAKNKAVSSESP